MKQRGIRPTAWLAQPVTDTLVDGDLASRTAVPIAALFRSRQPIHQRAVAEVDGGSRHLLQHEFGWQRLGQCRDREFFSSFKTERCRKVHRSREPARANAFDYIERFYNSERPHSMPAYLIPIDFEK